MTFSSTDQHDTPESRRYHRIQRRLSLADLGAGLVLLIVLLATGWTGLLRDWAYHGARQNYILALFFYVGMLSIVSTFLGLPLDFYGFRLEHRFHLSNQSFASWVWDQIKSWVHFGGLSVANGRVYLGTYDSILYCFGLPGTK